MTARARAAHLYERGVSATAAGHPAAGARDLRAGLRLLGWKPSGPRTDLADPALAARAMISLAHATAELGDTRAGLALLAGVAERGLPVKPGILSSQQGLLHMRTGNWREALALVDEAIRALEPGGDTLDLSTVLVNRSALLLLLGKVGPARVAGLRCVGVVERFLSRPGAEDDPATPAIRVMGAKAAHNLGYCELSAGDIPAALRAFDAAARAYRVHADGFVPVALIDKAKALLTAGLARQAGRELDEAIPRFQQQRLTQDYGEALVLRAEVALALEDLPAAETWATRARDHFSRRGNAAWSALAALTLIQVRFREHQPAARLATRAAHLAERLRGLDLHHAAVTADLLAIRAMVRAGRLSTAERSIATWAKAPPAAPVQNRLLRRLALAEIDVALGAPGRALTHLRSGLAVLHDHRSRFGSLDLQTGVSALGVELARLGLSIALSDGSPRLVYSWSERTRAQAFRLRHVRPPDDPVLAEALAELRQLQTPFGRPGAGPRADSSARRRCAELEAMLTDRDWHTSGPGQGTAIVGFDEVAAELAALDRTMLVLFRHQKRFVGLLIDDRRGSLVELGSVDLVEAALGSLLAELDILASPRLPQHVSTRIEAAMRRHRDILAAELIRPLAPLLRERELVIVPASSLSTVPWGLLPPFAGLPVNVAPSATAWLAARRALASTGTTGHRVALIAGPDLWYAEAEVAALEALYKRSVVLRRQACTVDAALGAIDGATIAHFAAHGHHQPDNVQFSRLQLDDGPMMAYDIGRVTVPPRQVILSSCRLGRVTARPGDEILGFTAALLHAGTPNVISSTARVLDKRSYQLMIAYHSELARGYPPAQALALASLAVPGTPFVCFGAG